MTTRRSTRPAAVLTAALALVLPAVVSGSVATASTTGTTAADGGKLLLVLDSSGSMAEPATGATTRIDAAKAALTTVVDNLPDTATVGMRVYGATVDSGAGACTDSQNLVPVGPVDRSALTTAITTYSPLGETPTGYALQQAATDLGPEGQRTIVLVSDGESTCDPDPCEVAAQLAADGIDLKVDVVGLNVTGTARDQLQCVAEAGNGTYYDASDAETLVTGLDRLSTRAFRSFQTTGTPITGTSGAVGAPLVEPGQYVDTVPGREEFKHYLFQRSIPGSTLHVGASGLAPKSSDKAQFGLKIDTAGGRTCGFGYGMGSSYGGSRILVSTSAVSQDTVETTPDDECLTDDELVVKIEQTQWSDGFEAEPFELVVFEEPPVTDAEELPDVATDRPVWVPMSLAAAPATDITPGVGFSDAPRLEPGNHSFEMLPGETQVFRVAVDWGQRLQVQTSVAPASAALKEAIEGPQPLDTAIISPTRTDAAAIFAEGEPGGSRIGLPSREGTIGSVSTVEVRYANRAGCCDSLKGTSLAGDYYVTVSLADDEQGESYLVPYDLGIALEGTAGTGEPTYTEGSLIGGLLAMGDEKTSQDSDDEVSSAAPDEESSAAPSDDQAEPVSSQEASADTGLPLALWLAVAGLVLLGVGGAVLVTVLQRGRRS